MNSLFTSNTGWVSAFIIFIEDLYSSFIRQNTFTIEQAWELTTQLARRVLVEVAVPRNGVTSAINIKEYAKTKLLVLWPILKSHDVMKAYKDANFSDHPTISSEYVKFLVFNSSGDGTKELKAEIKVLKEENVSMAKSIKAATTSENTAMNLVDELKKEFEYEKKQKK